MLSSHSAAEILDRQFLETRARVLQIAADLDRLDRAEGNIGPDPRLEQLRSALEVLLREGPNRAEEVQLIFSRQYSENWKHELGVS